MALKTRQKSCVPCANAKRRCDMSAPACSRCVMRGVECEYKAGSSQRRSKALAQANALLPHPSAPSHPDAVTENTLLPLDVYPSPPARDVEFLASDTGSSVDNSFFTNYDNRLLSYPLPQIGFMDRPRIKFLVAQLKSYPSKLVQTSRTPFIHPHLLSPSIQPALQNAISASALYAAKNSANETMVWDIISNSISSLHMQSQSPWSLSTHLACVQALIIFQIIRLFDGDIRQRSEAEMSEPVLEDWTTSLATRTSITTSPPTAAQTSWDSWVFSETVSRTVIVSLMVQAMYSIQKQGFCTLVDAVTELSFTVQKALWSAPSGLHWQQYYDSVPRMNVVKMEFGEIIESARAEDLDELGLLVIITYKGIDGVNEWILKKGGSGMIE